MSRLVAIILTLTLATGCISQQEFDDQDARLTAAEQAIEDAAEDAAKLKRLVEAIRAAQRANRAEDEAMLEAIEDSQ